MERKITFFKIVSNGRSIKITMDHSCQLQTVSLLKSLSLHKNTDATKGATKKNIFYSQHFAYKLFFLQTCVELKIKDANVHIMQHIKKKTLQLSENSFIY